MNKLFFIFLAGCASWGQYAYTGPAKTVVINEYIIEQPEPPRYGSIRSGMPAWDFFNAPALKVVEVSNGTNKSQTVTIYCNYVQFSGPETLTIPPHKTQELLKTTIGLYMHQRLCRLQ